MLLAVFPFLAAALLYWMTCADVFAVNPSDVPSSWAAKLYLPILTGTLASLAAAAATKGDKGLLLSVAAVGVLFTIATAAVCRSDEAYFNLQLRVGVGAKRVKRVTWWKVMRLVGLAVMGYGAVATVLAV